MNFDYNEEQQLLADSVRRFLAKDYAFEARKKIIRQFEKRVLDEQAHYLMTLQWHRIIPHSSKLHGWTITPSHYLNNTLDTVWLSP